MAWVEGLPDDVTRDLVPSRWRRVLGLGPSLAQWRAAVQRLVEHREQGRERNIALRRERGEARKALDDFRGTSEREIRRLRAVIAERLNEPPAVEGCTKVRLHTETDAQRFADRLVADTGEPREAYRAYKCPVCPRHPSTMNRVWHVGHQGKVGQRAKAAGEQRAGAAARKAARNGTELRARISPEALAKLRVVRGA